MNKYAEKRKTRNHNTKCHLNLYNTNVITRIKYTLLAIYTV